MNYAEHGSTRAGSHNIASSVVTNVQVLMNPAQHERNSTQGLQQMSALNISIYRRGGGGFDRATTFKKRGRFIKQGPVKSRAAGIGDCLCHANSRLLGSNRKF